MLKSQKKQSVSDLQEIFKESSAVIVAHYHGLSVAQLTLLRKRLRKDNASFKIIKNTLSKIAAQDTTVNPINALFSGPTAIAYSKDPTTAAKNIVEFAQEAANEQLKIIGGIVNNRVLDAEGVERLAKLPSLDSLRGKIIGLLQAPAAGIVGVLQAPASQLARVIQAYSKK